MKIFFTFITIFCACLLPMEVQAQGISISVIVPENSEYLNVSQLNRLRTKIEQIASANGVSALSNSNFVLYPVFEINESTLVEGGMRNMTMIDASLTLFIRQLDTRMIVSSVSLDLEGTGYSKGDALINAMRKIKPYRQEFKDFIAEGKQRIESYYKSNFASIRAKAKTLAAQQQYEEALALLMSYPEELPGYQTMAQDASAVYVQYMDNYCGRLLAEAKSRFSLNDYEGTASLLAQIDPSCSCAKEASDVMASMQQEIDAHIAYERKMELYKYRTETDLKKQRINAITEIVKAYFSRKPPVNYYQLIL